MCTRCLQPDTQSLMMQEHEHEHEQEEKTQLSDDNIMSSSWLSMLPWASHIVLSHTCMQPDAEGNLPDTMVTTSSVLYLYSKRLVTSFKPVPISA